MIFNIFFNFIHQTFLTLMKNFFVALLVFLVYSLFGMWYYSCIIKGLCSNDAVSATTSTPENSVTKQSIDIEKETKKVVLKDNITSDGFVIRDAQQNEVFTFLENININSSEGTVLIPNSLASFKDSIYAYLNTNQNKELIITGLYGSNETNTIGLERANEVKAILEDFGVNSDKLSVTTKVADLQFDNQGNSVGGINFSFKNLSKERLTEIESGITNKILYSGFGSKQFAPDNTLQAYALELKNYLLKYPNKKATITGHTDSVGDEIANDWFGMERAKNVKKYLVSQGISENKLTALSKGETAPIATNGTLEGRRKNRRIEIKVN